MQSIIVIKDFKAALPLTDTKQTKKKKKKDRGNRFERERLASSYKGLDSKYFQLREAIRSLSQLLNPGFVECKWPQYAHRWPGLGLLPSPTDQCWSSLIYWTSIRAPSSQLLESVYHSQISPGCVQKLASCLIRK